MPLPLTAYVCEEGDHFVVRTATFADGTVATNEAGVVMEDMGIARGFFHDLDKAEQFAEELRTNGISTANGAK